MTDSQILNYRLPSGNRMEVVRDYQTMSKLWPLFQAGLAEFNNPRKTNLGEPVEAFLKRMLFMVSEYPKSCVGVLRSMENGEPLGFGCCIETTTIFKPDHRVLHVYGVYSNGKYHHTVKELFQWVQDFCRHYQYNEIAACSGRLSGSSKKWFKEILGFTPKFVEYRKEVK